MGVSSMKTAKKLPICRYSTHTILLLSLRGSAQLPAGETARLIEKKTDQSESTLRNLSAYGGFCGSLVLILDKA